MLLIAEHDSHYFDTPSLREFVMAQGQLGSCSIIVLFNMHTSMALMMRLMASFATGLVTVFAVD